MTPQPKNACHLRRRLLQRILSPHSVCSLLAKTSPYRARHIFTDNGLKCFDSATTMGRCSVCQSERVWWSFLLKRLCLASRWPLNKGAAIGVTQKHRDIVCGLIRSLTSFSYEEEKMKPSADNAGHVAVTPGLVRASDFIWWYCGNVSLVGSSQDEQPNES